MAMGAVFIRAIPIPFAAQASSTRSALSRRRKFVLGRGEEDLLHRLLGVAEPKGAVLGDADMADPPLRLELGHGRVEALGLERLGLLRTVHHQAVDVFEPQLLEGLAGPLEKTVLGLVVGDLELGRDEDLLAVHALKGPAQGAVMSGILLGRVEVVHSRLVGCPDDPLVHDEAAGDVGDFEARPPEDAVFADPRRLAGDRRI